MNNQNENGNNRPTGERRTAPRRATNPGAVRRPPQNPGANHAPHPAEQGAPRRGTNPGAKQPNRRKPPQKRKKAKKHRSLGVTIGIIISAAAICVLLTFLALYIMGFRYMSYEVTRADEVITVKYVGRVDGDGNPCDGKVIYPDKTGKLAKDTSGENEDWYTIAYSNGDVYKGYLKKALKHGYGIIVYANGDRYEGNFDHDVISGTSSETVKCTYTYKNKDQYVGDFLNGNKHGQGKMTYADGSYYEGSFKNDMRDGEGTQVYSDGSKYVGSFTADLRNGYGEHTWANGDSYKGSFENGVKSGKGIYTWANGDSYNGEFVNGDLQGSGTYTLADGKMYIGEFENGQIVIGEGTIKDSTPQE